MSEFGGIEAVQDDDGVAANVLDAYGFTCIWGGLFTRDAFIDQAHVIVHESQPRTIIERAVNDGQRVLIGPSAIYSQGSVTTHRSTEHVISVGVWVPRQDYSGEVPEIPGVIPYDQLDSSRPRSIQPPKQALNASLELGPYDVD